MIELERARSALNALDSGCPREKWIRSALKLLLSYASIFSPLTFFPPFDSSNQKDKRFSLRRFFVNYLLISDQDESESVINIIRN